MGSSKKLRDDRLELPLTPAKTMLKRAASAEEGSLSVFVLDKGLEAAAECSCHNPPRGCRVGIAQSRSAAKALDDLGQNLHLKVQLVGGAPP